MDTDKLAAATDKLAAATASLTRSESPTQTAKALEVRVSRATLTGTPDAVTACGRSGEPTAPLGW
jgi:hypothetical protein